MISFIAAAILAQTAIPSVSIPPQPEPTIVFTDAGNTYIVSLRSEKITKIAGSVNPTPTPGPTPPPGPPPPVPVSVKPAWMSLVVAPDDTNGLTLRADKTVRDALAKSGVNYRAYTSNEAEFTQFGLSTAVGDTKLPAIVTQRADGTVLEVKPVGNADDILRIVGGWK